MIGYQSAWNHATPFFPKDIFFIGGQDYKLL